MSHTYSQPAPYQLSAGLLALVVHGAFIALLMYGMRWESHVAEPLTVELWSNLPSTTVVTEVVQPAPLVLPEVVAPIAVEKTAPSVKADIELREKKISKTEPPKPTAKELKERQQAEELRVLEEYAQHKRAQQEAVRAEMNAATAAEVGRYQDMIRSKIRRNIVGIPPDLPDSALAKFKVTLLPDGSVLDAKLESSCGNKACDDAIERAIYKAQPLPLPREASLQQMFRVLRLSIKPKE